MLLNKKEKSKLYDYLSHYENDVKNNYGHYDLNNPQLQSFVDSNDIAFCSNKAKGEQAMTHAAYFRYQYKTADKAHDLMRHIRNAIAHGNIKKKGSNYYLMDYNQCGTKTLDAKIPVDVFWNFLAELENTYH